MKKVVSILMVVIFIISAVGCSNEQKASTEEQTGKTGKIISQEDENVEQKQEKTGDSKEEIYQDALQSSGEKSPSELFASGAVFDITRQNHDEFADVVNSLDAHSLLEFFTKAYITFCNQPQIVGFSSAMVDVEKNDTDYRMWNTDIVDLSSGGKIALCYMPIDCETHTARIIGIVLDENGDEYYYCMLDKDENAFSDVVQNKAMLGIQKIGEIKGRGFELMNNFIECIDNN